MRGLGSRRWRGGQTLGVMILTLGLAHVPLPQADFHNIRHHDAPGELCEHHDHLLRWHPDARSARDVAVLHWHWVFASAAGDESAAPDGSTAAIHAHAPDWPSACWDDAPLAAPDRTVRAQEMPSLTGSSPAMLDAAGDPSRAASRACWRVHGAPGAPGVSLVVRLQRWVC